MIYEIKLTLSGVLNSGYWFIVYLVLNLFFESETVLELIVLTSSYNIISDIIYTYSLGNFCRYTYNTDGVKLLTIITTISILIFTIQKQDPFWLLLIINMIDKIISSYSNEKANREGNKHILKVNILVTLFLVIVLYLFYSNNMLSSLKEYQRFLVVIVFCFTFTEIPIRVYYYKPDLKNMFFSKLNIKHEIIAIKESFIYVNDFLVSKLTFAISSILVAKLTFTPAILIYVLQLQNFYRSFANGMSFINRYKRGRYIEDRTYKFKTNGVFIILFYLVIISISYSVYTYSYIKLNNNIELTYLVKMILSSIISILCFYMSIESSTRLKVGGYAWINGVVNFVSYCSIFLLTYLSTTYNSIDLFIFSNIAYTFMMWILFDIVYKLIKNRVKHNIK